MLSITLRKKCNFVDVVEIEHVLVNWSQLPKEKLQLWASVMNMVLNI
jgi:hypothetical protein